MSQNTDKKNVSIAHLCSQIVPKLKVPIAFIIGSMYFWSVQFQFINLEKK